jgi:hypothetical protein
MILNQFFFKQQIMHAMAPQRSFVEKLIVVHLVKKVSAVYRGGKFRSDDDGGTVG